MLRLLALDLDGTALSNRHRLEDPSIKALERAKAEDVFVTFVSGRPCGLSEH